MGSFDFIALMMLLLPVMIGGEWERMGRWRGKQIIYTHVIFMLFKSLWLFKLEYSIIIDQINWTALFLWAWSCFLFLLSDTINWCPSYFLTLEHGSTKVVKHNLHISTDHPNNTYKYNDVAKARGMQQKFEIKTCLERAFSIVPQTGRMRPPKTFTSCNLLPTVQKLPTLHLGPCIHCSIMEIR